MASKRILLLLISLIAFAATDALAAKPLCGDGKCNGKETAATCALDCDASAGFCGDNICSSDESCSSCEADCGACPPAGDCNYDNTCNLGEDCLSCPDDCSGLTGGKPSNRYCCGGSTADTLFCDLQPQCGPNCGLPPTSDPVCGNGALEAGEECDDGNTVDGDGCSSQCTDEYCGNGTVEAGEQCDDGNLNAGDGCDSNCRIENVPGLAPANQFNIGDSIGEAEAANGTIGAALHQSVWSSGYSASDSVNSINERYEANAPAGYYENNSTRDAIFNKAISGSVMANFAAQAQQVVNSTGSVPNSSAGQVTILLGANDVCADSNAQMTAPAVFEDQFRAGLDILAGNEVTRMATIHVSSLPAIYWLWESRADESAFSWCRLFAWPNVPCQNLLAKSADDCASAASREDPDTLYPGDGPNCVRRKEFHARIRDEFNPRLQNVVQEYVNRPDLPLPNAEFIDIFDVRFYAAHVNSGDCFHPSYLGHSLLSEKQYCRSGWSEGDAACAP